MKKRAAQGLGADEDEEDGDGSGGPSCPSCGCRVDPEQLNEVLDAMFHREVVKGENIITQGADGDNFYVIER